MNEAIVDRWNSVVRTKDTVWVLGDVLFGQDNFWYLPRLNGTKHLVLGNHDHYPKERYLEHFNKIEGVASFDKCILSHVPVHPNQLEYRFKANLHGHMHSKNVIKSIECLGPNRYVEHKDERYINVSVEQNNLTPFAWEDLSKRIVYD